MIDTLGTNRFEIDNALSTATITGGTGSDTIAVTDTGFSDSFFARASAIDVLSVAATENATTFAGGFAQTAGIRTISNDSTGGEQVLNAAGFSTGITIIGGATRIDTITAGAGNDTITAGTGVSTAIDSVNGGGGNDVINYSNSNVANTLNGDAGADTITGGVSADVITGGVNADSISGGAGADVIIQSTGNSVAATAVTLATVDPTTTGWFANGSTFVFGNGVDVITGTSPGPAVSNVRTGEDTLRFTNQLATANTNITNFWTGGNTTNANFASQLLPGQLIDAAGSGIFYANGASTNTTAQAFYVAGTFSNGTFTSNTTGNDALVFTVGATAYATSFNTAANVQSFFTTGTSAFILDAV